MSELYTIDEASPADQVYQRLRRLLIEGYYPPGSRLVEERLAQDLGVSRTPVRQALVRAAAEGLVHLFPNRGAVARSFTIEDLMEIYDLRALLEGHAAYLAAQRITAEQIARMEAAATALEESLTRTFERREDEVHFLVEQNAIFHGTIAAASGNQRLVTMINQIVAVPLQFRSFYWYRADERRISNFFHRSILHALRLGDGDRARAVMREHILYGRDVLLQSQRAESSASPARREE
ncbi:MAG: GntR family transcriptional regulator [Roseiflexus sp.]|nr:GntR family transcriptional regulator [Roseiflexus sp.]MCS7289605.1 GntR family transcriptional regulator [Roseiflexus sp.]MDW8146377.1 GntR family transcriptional regulator [Roseiflexaceae bacterium]MDW8233209.1 GntR family transcriptional regulator [Roseiflexaceae bacterium]